jgi:hypothetical protein
MSLISKRRHEVRYPLAEELPATVLLRSVKNATTRGVPGLLIDVSKSGMGVLVQEHVALESRCVVEVQVGKKVQRFRGEVCYGRRTPRGIKLGIMFTKQNEQSILDFLASLHIDYATVPTD